MTIMKIIFGINQETSLEYLNVIHRNNHYYMKILFKYLLYKYFKYIYGFFNSNSLNKTNIVNKQSIKNFNIIW